MEKVIDVVGNLKATRWGKGHHDWTFVLSTMGGVFTVSATQYKHNRKFLVCRRILK